MLERVLTFIVLFGSAGGVLFGVYKCVKRLDDMQRESAERKQESVLMIHGVLAALDGLTQLGANGPVTKAKEQLQNYIIEH